MNMGWVDLAEILLYPLIFFGGLLAFIVFVGLSFFSMPHWYHGLLLLPIPLIILLLGETFRLPVTSYPLILVNYGVIAGAMVMMYRELLR